MLTACDRLLSNGGFFIPSAVKLMQMCLHFSSNAHGSVWMCCLCVFSRATLQSEASTIILFWLKPRLREVRSRSQFKGKLTLEWMAPGDGSSVFMYLNTAIWKLLLRHPTPRGRANTHDTHPQELWRRVKAWNNRNMQRFSFCSRKPTPYSILWRPTEHEYKWLGVGLGVDCWMLKGHFTEITQKHTLHLH